MIQPEQELQRVPQGGAATTTATAMRLGVDNEEQADGRGGGGVVEKKSGTYEFRF